MTRLNQPTALLLGALYALVAVVGHGFHDHGAGCCGSEHAGIAAAEVSACGCGLACHAADFKNESFNDNDGGRAAVQQSAELSDSRATSNSPCVACQFFGLLKQALSSSDTVLTADALPPSTVGPNGVLLLAYPGTSVEARGPPAC